MKIIYLDKNLYCTRAAYVWDGELWGFNAEDGSITRIVSNIYKAKVVRVVLGIEAVFVDLGKSKTGFLPVNAKDIGTYKEGDYIMCQVKRDNFGSKDAAVKEDITLAGNLLIYLPQSQGVNVSKKICAESKSRLLKLFSNEMFEGGIIFRTASEHAGEELLFSELKQLTDKWTQISERYKRLRAPGLIYRELDLYERLKRDQMHCIDKIITNDYEAFKDFEHKAEFFDKGFDLFDYYGLRRDIEDIANKKVELPNGGSLVFGYTEACTFIDVNTSRNIGKGDMETTLFETNIIAAREIIRQLALRNIGGAIIVDFINMREDAHKEELVKALVKYSELDSIDVTVLGMTKLGLVEITRRKIELQRDVLLLEPCKGCGGTGKIFRSEYMLCRILGKAGDIIRENNCKRLTIFMSSRLCDTVNASPFMKECERRFPDTEITIILDEGIGNAEYRIQI